MQTLRVTRKPYSVFEIYHVKYKKFSSILYLSTFAVHCAVKFHVYHVKYTDFIFIPHLSTMQTLRVTHKPYSVFEIYNVKYINFSSILYLATFAVHCAVKSNVYHV